MHNKLPLKNVLVSGAGGDIGSAIGRILIEQEIGNIVGCDIQKDHAGECIFHNFVLVPIAKDKDYFSSIKNIFKKFKIELFIPTSEAEILAILNFGLINGKLFEVPVLIADTNTVFTALDKLKTSQAVEKLGINFPWTKIANSLPPELPCIFKPRSGQGSKNVKIVKSKAEAELLVNDTSHYIWQELLLPEDQEFTCAVYKSVSDECRIIIIKRTLLGGFTNKGEVVDDTTIYNYIESIVEGLNINGAVNIQLRLTSRGPVLFEINPRLSSTVMFRHKLGFTDLIWAIEDILNISLSPYKKPKTGTKFFRGIQEYIKQG